MNANSESQPDQATGGRAGPAHGKAGARAGATAIVKVPRPFTLVDTGYLIVFVLIVVSYIVSALQESGRPSPLALILQLVSVVVIFRVTEVNIVFIRIIDVIIVISILFVIASVWLSWAANIEREWLDIVLSALSTAFYLLTPIVIIQHQLRRSKVDIQTLIASISAYLLIAMFFTFAFNLIGLIEPGKSFGTKGGESLSAQLFYSFTTITTIGKSELGPVTALAQSLTIAEVVIGQLFLVVAVAKVVNDWTPPLGGRFEKQLQSDVAQIVDQEEARDESRDAARDARRDAVRDAERDAAHDAAIDAQRQASGSAPPSGSTPPESPPSPRPPTDPAPPTGAA